MTRFLTLAAGLLGLCVVTPSTRAGSTGPPPSLMVEFVDIGSSFAGGMTTVTASLFSTVGSTQPSILFGATFLPAPGFTGGFMGGPISGTLGSFGNYCDPGDVATACLFPLSFSAEGHVGGPFATTATISGGFPPVSKDAGFSVPEPASLALLSIALVGAGLARRKAAR